jgi:hypothetical protein
MLLCWPSKLARPGCRRMPGWRSSVPEGTKLQAPVWRVRSGKRVGPKPAPCWVGGRRCKTQVSASRSNRPQRTIDFALPGRQ